MRKYDAPNMPVGTLVRSHFHAKWFGHVVEEVGEWKSKAYAGQRNHVVRCLITHDRWGRPLRKPKKSQALSTYWLEVLAPEAFAEQTVQSSPSA